MGKGKNKQRKKQNISLLTDYVFNDIKSCNASTTINTVKKYLDLCDGSTLPESYEWEIINLFSQYPTLMKLIVSAHEERF
mgnify:CR=1 FL=1